MYFCRFFQDIKPRLPFLPAMEVASAVIMSQILFFVNITMFDPREAFQVVNMGFYIVTWHVQTWLSDPWTVNSAKLTQISMFGPLETWIPLRSSISRPLSFAVFYPGAAHGTISRRPSRPEIFCLPVCLFQPLLTQPFYLFLISMAQWTWSNSQNPYTSHNAWFVKRCVRSTLEHSTRLGWYLCNVFSMNVALDISLVLGIFRAFWRAGLAPHIHPCHPCKEVQLVAVILNAFLVWVVVPKLRNMQARLLASRKGACWPWQIAIQIWQNVMDNNIG